MSDCPFCSIPTNSTESVVAQNEYCYLLDNPEGSLQHGLLIIPFRHIETPFEFSPEEWASLQPLIHHAHDVLSRHNPDGFNLGWNVGRIGGQEVAHVHLHVMARFSDEPFAGSGIRRWFKSDENQRPKDKKA